MQLFMVLPTRKEPWGISLFKIKLFPVLYFPSMETMEMGASAGIVLKASSACWDILYVRSAPENCRRGMGAEGCID